MGFKIILAIVCSSFKVADDTDDADAAAADDDDAIV